MCESVNLLCLDTLPVSVLFFTIVIQHWRMKSQSKIKFTTGWKAGKGLASSEL